MAVAPHVIKEEQIGDGATSNVFKYTFSNGAVYITKNAPRDKNTFKTIISEIEIYKHLRTFPEHEKYIMPVFDTTIGDDTDSFVGTIDFVFLEGHDLYTELQRKDITPEEICSYFQQMVQALLWLGDKGYYHGDIKENNFFVEKPANKVRLLDFGMTKHIFSNDYTSTKDAKIREDLQNVLYMILRRIPSFKQAKEKLLGEIQTKVLLNNADKQLIKKAYEELNIQVYVKRRQDAHRDIETCKRIKQYNEIEKFEKIKKEAEEEINKYKEKEKEIENKSLKGFLIYFYEKILHELQFICPDLSPGGAAGSPGGAAGGLGGAAGGLGGAAGGGRRRRKAHKSRKAIKRQRKHHATRNAQRKNA